MTRPALLPPVRGFALLLLGLFLVLALGIGLAGHFYYVAMARHYRDAVEADLSAIAALKVRQIADWRAWQMSTAAAIARNPFAASSVDRLLYGRHDAALDSALQQWLASFAADGDYSAALLFDSNACVRAWEPRRHVRDSGSVVRDRSFVLEALRKRAAVLSDFHRDDSVGTVLLCLAVPIPGPFAPVAALLLRVEPSHYLYRLVQSWPVPSRSAEVLMVRREGNDVLYLNELRHRSNTALSLRLPIDAVRDRPAAMAVLGTEGIVEGRDYRDVAVLAAVRSVPGSPWFLEAKVDQSELFAPLRERGLLLAALMALLVALCGGAVAAIWHRQRLTLVLNRQLEQRVAERTSELEAANRELDAFAYSVAHDLRTPLRSIDGFSQALLEDCGQTLNAVARTHLDRVRNAARRMAELIDDLLSLSRVSRAELRRQQVDLSAMARSIAAELQAAELSRQVRFVIGDAIQAEADPHLTRQVLENLLRNAWKFTSRHQQACIEFGVDRQDGQEVYLVRDDGAGFDMAYVHRLFTPFQRLHAMDQFPGTGIGLALVQRIVQRHGGRVWAEGATDKGAAFYFTLQPTPQPKRQAHG